MFSSPMAMAAHDAFLLRTEGATGEDMNAVMGAIYARFGANTTIHIIYGSGAMNFNGSEIRNFGAGNLERFDTASATMPVAERFFVSADNFTLASNQSIWSAGSRLVVLEFGGNVTFESGSYVGVSAIGALGMAGGGDGGVPTPRPFETLNFRDTKQDPPGYTVGQGGTVSSVATKGEDGQRMAIYNVQVGSVQIVPENTYASSTGGGTGYIGQGDQWFLGIGQGYSGLATGGPAVLFNGVIPAGGPGGQPGLQGSSTIFGGGNGGPGNPGIIGANGTNGVAGANGLIDTLAGSALHLRGGSGGGAGATGGFGLGAGVGGSGGGGGANGDGGLFVPVVAGGNGGKGGAGGVGGKGGVGGRGGAGGGGIQVVVRGVFNNGATWEAKGTAGVAGEAGTVGTDGAAGSPGGPGLPSLSLQSGAGGSGGPGGKGGTGGKGGNGSGGSGGNIQIVAAQYNGLGAQFSVAGGGSAPAGLVQIHGFNGTSQNAPFGAFAAEYNPYVSNVSLLSNPIPPTPGLKPGSTPRFPKMIGGPASYGLSDGLPSTLTQVSSKLAPPPNCDAVIFRVDAEDMQNYYANHDLLAFVNVRNGTTLPSPKIAAVDPADSAQQGTNGKVVYLPTPQPLMANKGYLNDPVITPGGTGPVPTDNPRGKVWLTTVARDRAYEVSAQWSPYGTVRTVRGTPVRGSLYSDAIGAPVALYLNDNGNPSMVLEETNSEYPVNTSEYMLETPTEQSIVRYYRQGSSPTFTFKVSNQHGNPHSRGSGNAICDGYLPNSVFPVQDAKSYSNRTKTDAPVTVSATVPTKDYPYKSEVILASGSFIPKIDSIHRGSLLHVYGRIVGPLPLLDGLTGGSLPCPVTNVGQTSQASFDVFNGDSLSLEWSMAVYNQPKLARLSVLSAQIVNDPAGAFSMVTPLPSTIDLGWTKSYTVNFTPPTAGKYTATLRLRTDHLAALGQPGQIFDIPLEGSTVDFTTWAALLPEGQRGANDDANSNGIPNLIEYGLNGGGHGDLPKVMPGSPSSQASFNLPEALRPDVQWAIEGSANLASWQRVGSRNPANGTWSTIAPMGGIVEQLTGGVRRTSVTMPSSPQKYFIRLVGTRVPNDYSNDFSTATGATLRGTAVWSDGKIQLSDGSAGQSGSAVLDGFTVWAGQTGFNAKFDLQMLSELQVAGNGMTFSVGDLGTGAWGLNGPVTARNLTIGFETFYPFAEPPLPKGYRVMVNGTMVASLPVYAFSGDVPVPIDVTYTPATGLTLVANGNPIFTNVPVPGFTLQAGDQFGFGNYGGTPPAATRVDNVVILPR